MRAMKDAPPVIILINNRSIIDILKSVSLSVQEKYFRGNSEAYGNLQHDEYPLEDPAINYFVGDA